MRKAFLWLFLFCAVSNAIGMAIDWYNGTPANFWVWLFAILFSIDVAITVVKDLRALR